jgi:hypothetical protein
MEGNFLALYRGGFIHEILVILAATSLVRLGMVLVRGCVAAAAALRIWGRTTVHILASLRAEGSPPRLHNIYAFSDNPRTKNSPGFLCPFSPVSNWESAHEGERGLILPPPSLGRVPKRPDQGQPTAGIGQGCDTLYCPVSEGY